MRGEWRDGDRTRVTEVTALGNGRFRVVVDGVALELEVERLSDGRVRLATAESATHAEVTASGERRFVRLGTLEFVLERMTGGAGGARKRSGPAGGGLESPMPGVVTRVLVKAGDEVKKGQPLVALEAMKMEHLIRAPRDGKVRAVAVRTGELVDGGVALVELEGEG